MSDLDSKYSTTLSIAKKYGIKVVPLYPKTKKPVGEAWQKEYHNWEEYFYLDSKFNIGFQCGDLSNNVYGVDVDDLETSKLIMKDLPKTLTVKSGNKGYHFYFKSEENFLSKKLDFYNKDKEKIRIDIQSNKTQLVAPPSIHPETKKEYKFIILSDIQTKEYKEIFDIITNLMKNRGYKLKNLNVAKDINFTSLPKTESNNTNEKEWKELSFALPSMQSMTGFAIGKSYPHPIHGAKTGGNFTVYGDDEWFCFHCGVIGHKMQWKALEILNIQNCQEIFNLSSEQWKEIANKIREEYNIPNNFGFNKKIESIKEKDKKRIALWKAAGGH